MHDTSCQKKKKKIFEWYRLATWRNVWLSKKKQKQKGSKEKKEGEKEKEKKIEKRDIKNM